MLKLIFFFLYQLIIFFIFNVYGLPFDTQYNTNHKELWNLKNEMEPYNQLSLLQSYMDRTVDPCEDFHQYACGNWKKHFEIPIDSSAIDDFFVLNEKLKKSILEILIENQKEIKNNKENHDKFDIEEQIDIFYSSCLDIETINKRGSEPIIQFLKEIGGFPLLDGNKWSSDNYHLEDVLAFQSLYQTESFFHSDISQDLKDANKNVIYLNHPKLGLRSHADYLESYNKPHLDGYRDFISEIFELLNAPKEEIAAVVDDIIVLETKLANLTDDSKYEIEEQYNAETIDTLNKKYPKFNWREYIQKIYNINLNDDVKVVIFGAPKTDEIFDILINIDKNIIANYISWRTIQQFLDYLDYRFIASKNKLKKILSGSDESKRERDLICAEEANKNVGMAINALYVKKFFDENSKDDVSKITQSIIKAFRDNLNSYDWIDDETKKLAEAKVNKIVLAVGYPDFILNKTELNTYYEGVHFEEGKYFENYLNLKCFKNIEQQKQLGKEIDKLEWSTIPAMINAFFEQQMNRIIIPAGILQPPFYLANFTKYLNYGKIGFIIGHELTHGFDTGGRLFDEDGNLKNWWDDKSSQQFNDRAQCFIDQYSKYEIYNKTLNGYKTKADNIADNGGIRLAYKIYSDWLNGASKEEKENEVIPELNLSPKQLFFVAFAQSWCEYIRPEAIENRLETDIHSPGKLRIIGSLQNFEEFSKVYQCSLNSTMNPDKKCKLW